MLRPLFLPDPQNPNVEIATSFPLVSRLSSLQSTWHIAVLTNLLEILQCSLTCINSINFRLRFQGIPILAPP